MLLKPFLVEGPVQKQRMQEVVRGGSSLRDKVHSLQKDKRRKQLQEILDELDAENKKRRKRVSLSMRLRRAGLNIDVWQFYVFALVSGALLGLFTLVTTSNMWAALAGLFVGAIGLPLWLLKFLQKRREEKFLQYFPDAIDVLVRSLRAGLPLNEALKLIAKEIPEPVSPEFVEVVEGQRVGIPLDQGFQRMYERLPLPEVNFLSIVISIQSKSGGNLSEALENLSTVLRDRKKMKEKVKILSTEAKVGAAILAAVPMLMAMIIFVFNPEFLAPFFNTKLGNFLVIFAIGMMMTGALVMRKMINFKF